jgi:serine/threonine protein kinase
MWETAEERGRKVWEDRQSLYTSFPNSVNLAEQRYHKYAKAWITVNEVLEQFYGAVAYIEYYSSGDLNSVMERYGVDADDIAQIPEAFVWVVFRSMANALFALEFGHEHGGVPINNWVPLRHRDIKLENIFLGEPKQDLFPAYPYPVLGDFDVALRMDPNDENYKAAKGPGLEPGTEGWRAPEDRHKRGKPQPSLKADVWAVGLVIWSLMNSRKGDWLETHRMSSTVGEKLKESKGPSFSWPEDSDPENPTVYYTTPLRDLVDDCLQLDPDDRPTATVLLRRVNKGLQMARRLQGDFENLTSDQIGAHIRLSYKPDQFSLGRRYNVKRRKDINTYNSSDPESDDQDGGSDGGGGGGGDPPEDDPPGGGPSRGKPGVDEARRKEVEEDPEYQKMMSFLTTSAPPHNPPSYNPNPEVDKDDIQPQLGNLDLLNDEIERGNTDDDQPPARSSTRRSRPNQEDSDEDDEPPPKRRRPGTDVPRTNMGSLSKSQHRAAGVRKAPNFKGTKTSKVTAQRQG